MNLTKSYRLVWNDSKTILSVGKYDSKSVTGCKNGFEAATKSTVVNKIVSLGLKFANDEQKSEWEKVK